MAESKFLPFQDTNGDGLIDICDIITVEEPKYCPECIPNPNAIVPNWHDRTRFEPFLNEKICHYQVAIKAKNHTTTGLPDPEKATQEEAMEALTEIFDEYFEMAIKGMLKVYNKDDSQDSLDIVKEAVEYHKFWLPPRPLSVLQLLYSVPKEVIDGLDDREDDEEEEDTLEGLEVTISAKAIGPMMMRVRKTLKLYTSYSYIYMANDGGNLLRVQDDVTFYLEPYGDWGF